MATNVVRVHYAQLTQAAATFGQHAEQARAVLQRLRQDLDRLQAGDWLGQGAQAFYAEMNGQVLPAMMRLVQALEQAADTSRQINQIAQQAEREAAACLRGEGGATGAGAAIGAAAAGLGLDSGGASAGPVGAGASAFVGGRADPNGGGGGATAKPKASPKAPVAPVVKGAADKKGQEAYNRYLGEYIKYQRQQSQSWNWKTVEQKIQAQEQTSKQLASNLDKVIVPALKELHNRENQGLDTTVQRQKVLDLIHQQSNLVAKAQLELLAVGDRAHELLLEAEKEITKDKVVTDAERRRVEDMSDSYRSLHRPTDINNEVAGLLTRLRTQVAEIK